MKKYKTGSDSGNILIGNDDCYIAIPNRMGDGDNTVLVFDDSDEYISYCKEEYGERKYRTAFNYVMQIAGQFNIYRDDCCDMDELDITATIIGKYDIYLRSELFERPVLAVIKKA